MRKLLLFFAMLCVSVGAWAANVSTYESGGVTTLYFDGFKAGDLKKLLVDDDETVATNSGVAKNYFSTSPLKIGLGKEETCELNADDLAALARFTGATILDMKRATLAEGTELTSVTSPSVEYIQLPWGEYTDDELQELNKNCPSLKFVAALSSEAGDNKKWHGYSFKEGNLQNFLDLNLVNRGANLSSPTTTPIISGKLNQTDLANINNVVGPAQRANVIDVSGSELTGGAYTDVVMNTDQLLIIPRGSEKIGWKGWPLYSSFYAEGKPHVGFWENGYKKFLNVYYATKAKDMSKLKDFVTNDMTLCILWHQSQDGGKANYAGYNNQDVNETGALYKEALHDLPVGGVDFTYCDISAFGTDFSMLNDATEHITIPQSTTTATPDFTDETTYTFNDHIKTVSTYKANLENYSSGACYDGYAVSFAHDGTDVDRRTNITYVRPSGIGSFGDAFDHFSDIQKDAERTTIVGNINSADVEGLQKTTTPKLDLSNVKTTDISLANYSNENTLYVALPDDYTGSLTAAHDNSSNIRGIGFHGTADDSFTYQSYVEGSLFQVVNMIESIKAKGAVSPKTALNQLKVLTVAGPVNAYDLSGAASIDENGHLAMSPTITATDVQMVPVEGVTTKPGALNGIISSTMTRVDLSAVTLPSYSTGEASYQSEDGSYQNDLCLSALALSDCQDIRLPLDHSVWMLPNSCFNSSKGPASLVVPGNYKVIAAGAFVMVPQLKHVTTTTVDENGNGTTTIIDKGAEDGKTNNTITLPPHLEKVGTLAYGSLSLITDVYITNEISTWSADAKFPECEVNAFNGETLYGNNTVHAEGRDYGRCWNYKDGQLQRAIAYLHWPVTDDMKVNEVYTDVTRQYSIQANDGVVDERGETIFFPSQNELLRSYWQATFGYTWDSWSNDRYTYLSYADQNLPSQFAYYDHKHHDVPQNQASADGYDISGGTAVYDTRYVGWHQFVLSMNYSYQSTTELPVAVKENDWYTICVPYDLTKSDLLSAFGAEYKEGVDTKVNGEVITEDKYPEVVTLMGVRRDKSQNLITLQFTHDLVANNQKWDFASYNNVNATYDLNNLYKTQTDADPVIIEKGKPYMIKPYLSEEALEKLQSGGFPTVLGVKQADQYCTPYDKYIVYATSDKDVKNYAGSQKFVDKDDKELASFDKTKVYVYHFIGTFEKKAGGVPMNTYYFSKSKSINNPATGTGKHMFFRHTMEEKAKTWSAYSCIIAPKDGGFQNSLDGDPTLNINNSKDDSFPGVSAPAKYMMSFDAVDEIVNGETTGLESISAVANSANGKVYNMNGQCVGNSLEGLSKGLYIMNGKKVIIK